MVNEFEKGRNAGRVGAQGIDIRIDIDIGFADLQPCHRIGKTLMGGSHAEGDCLAIEVKLLRGTEQDVSWRRLGGGGGEGSTTPLAAQIHVPNRSPCPRLDGTKHRITVHTMATGK